MPVEYFDDEVLDAARENREERERWIRHFDWRANLQRKGIFVPQQHSKGFWGMADEY